MRTLTVEQFENTDKYRVIITENGRVVTEGQPVEERRAEAEAETMRQYITLGG